MREIIIKTQSELDALPQSFSEFTVVKIQSAEWITVKTAQENSQVVAWGNSKVVARENSRVVARENSRVVARENSRVEAWGNSRVVAWENSKVVAWGNSKVEAWENSKVVAWGNVAVYNFSIESTVLLFAFAVCFVFNKAKAQKKSKTATVITPTPKPGASGWLEREGVDASKGNATLFKRVSKDFKTQENTPRETRWEIGSTLTHPEWNPKEQECGHGKYHACSRPYFCDEFRGERGDRYIAIQVDKKDLYAWPNASYPHKIAFRKGKVLYECDRFGDRIETKKGAA